MILSSRQNPPRLPSLPPPQPPSFNTRSVAPAIHLLQINALPSPSLPSILPRHGKKPPKLNSKASLRFLTWLAGFIVLFWAGKKTVEREWSPVALGYQSTDGKTYEIVGEDTLPDHPTPVVVADHKGSSKWTVSIPQRLDFPLKPSDYVDICAQARDVSQHVADLKTHRDTQNPPVHTAHHSYYYNDPYFVDVAEAQENDLLPRPGYMSATAKARICARSLTYVLESSSGGLAPTLMGLWLAYSLAQHEERAFFVDDTRWEYGNLSTFFHPPPTPDCLPPPKEQRVPCPHQARHLVVSAATTQWTFGAAFLDEFEDGRKMGVRRLEKIFGMLRGGYEAFFEGRLMDKGDVKFLNERVKELRKGAEAGMEIGMHVRHGDRHPYEFQYSKSYVPISKYVEAAQKMLANAGLNGNGSKIVVASDDPDVYGHEEIKSAGVLKTQSRISLTPAWGGGYFKELFWALGKHDAERLPQATGSPKPSRWDGGNKRASSAKAQDSGVEKQGQPTAEAMGLREAVARAYLLDLSILGQADRVVCAVSSHTCRVLAVIMGWERAVERAEWRNVDGDWGWRGLDW
jgi:hypothetical protein